MSTDLVPVSTFDLMPQAHSLAEQIADTDFAPMAFRKKPMAVMAAMLQGHELGIGPMASLAEIAVISGKPCMSAKLMRALVQRAGHDIWFESKTNTKVVICGQRQGWPEDRIAKVTWSMDDAKAAGLSGGQNYRKYPRAMLAARATGELCRDNFADVLGGIGYTPEELTDGDLIADGDLVVEGRDDIAPDAPATSTRRAAKAATAKRAPAAKKAAAPKPTPAATSTPLPPLPGEPGYDDPAEDIVDAEVVDDGPSPDLADIQARIDDLTQEDREDLGAWWKAEGIPPLKSGDVTYNQATAIHTAIDAYNAPAGPGPTEGRNKKMWAMVAEAWPTEDDQGRDELRRHLIGFVTEERTESSKDLAPPEWDSLFEALTDITAGTHELYLNANERWLVRKNTTKARS